MPYTFHNAQLQARRDILEQHAERLDQRIARADKSLEEMQLARLAVDTYGYQQLEAIHNALCHKRIEIARAIDRIQRGLPQTADPQLDEPPADVPFEITLGRLVLGALALAAIVWYFAQPIPTPNDAPIRDGSPHAEVWR